MKDQRTRIAKSLEKLAPNVTAADRSACIKAFKITKVTISNYLKGKVTNNDLALEMIGFFQDRIAKREEKLAKICQS